MHSILNQHTRISEGSGRRRHHSANECICLRGGGISNLQALHSDAVQCGVVNNHHTVRVENQSLHGENGVVRLHHHVFFSRKYRVTAMKHASEWMFPGNTESLQWNMQVSNFSRKQRVASIERASEWNSSISRRYRVAAMEHASEWIVILKFCWVDYYLAKGRWVRYKSIHTFAYYT